MILNICTCLCICSICSICFLMLFYFLLLSTTGIVLRRSDGNMDPNTRGIYCQSQDAQEHFRVTRIFYQILGGAGGVAIVRMRQIAKTDLSSSIYFFSRIITRGSYVVDLVYIQRRICPPGRGYRQHRSLVIYFSIALFSLLQHHRDHSHLSFHKRGGVFTSGIANSS